MFSLPAGYRRIPNEAKVVFPRGYDPKVRMALLERAVNIRVIYKEFLGNKISNYDRKRIQTGYRELLDLYDDYWNVPAEDRIRPSDVKNIYKPDKTHFFGIQE